jgi:hypothetical protein
MCGMWNQCFITENNLIKAKEAKFCGCTNAIEPIDIT